MTDVENLRHRARCIREAVVEDWEMFASPVPPSVVSRATRRNEDANALDRAADALALLDAAQSADAFPVTETGISFFVVHDPNDVNRTPFAHSTEELAHRLIVTALALLEADRAD
jgi:hypothetical protein